MRAAPPVEVPLAAAGPGRAMSAALHAAAAWSASTAFGAAGPWDTLAALAAAAAGAVLWRSPRGSLRWDGAAWAWVTPAGEVVPLARLRLQIDFGRWVLLRWTGAGARRATWASLGAAQAGAAWHGMRVALAAHARGAAHEGAAP